MTPTAADRQQAREIVSGLFRREGNTVSISLCELRLEADIASALAAARVQALEQAAALADGDAAKAAGLLTHAKKRYSKRKLLEAIGYQGDPDAECIHLEACEGTAKDIAAAIRNLSPQEPQDAP